MFDEGTGGARLERARGHAAAGVKNGRLTELRQSGSAKAMLPRTHGPCPEVVFLNTAGGVTGGDRFETHLSVENGTAIGTTQTAERAYRSAAGAAEIDVHLRVGAGAKLAWLPQETILYDGAAIQRETRAELFGDAEILLVDILVFGRIAMGETISRLSLSDTRRVVRDGRPVVLDPLRITGPDLERRGAASLQDARAIATLHLCARDAPDRLDRLRAVLPDDGSTAASAWDGRLTLRAMHNDPRVLRRCIARAIPCLTGQPLPRVWPNEWS